MAFEGIREPLDSIQFERLIDSISREFHDPAHLASNRTQLYNIWRGSALPERSFVRLVYDARAKTKQRGNIRTPAATGVFPGCCYRLQCKPQKRMAHG
jgi:hypothetical protein